MMRKSISAFAVFTFLCLNSPLWAQTEQCSPSLAGFARDGYPDELSLGLGDCNAHWEGTLPTTNVPARLTTATDATVPPGFLDAVVTALVETDRATSLLAAGPVDPGRAVEFIVAGPRTDGSGAYGETFSRGDVCHVVLLETSWSAANWAAEIGPTVAHEFFHCIQAAMATNLFFASPDWAIEGSATWFEHQVYSSVPHSFVDRFEDNVARIPFNELEDEAWVLFVWLAQSRGVDAIIPYLQGLPDISETVEGVIDALTPAQWVEFAITYTERNIFTRDWRRVAPTRNAPVEAAVIPPETDNADVLVPRGRAQMMRHHVTLSSGVWAITGQPGTIAYWTRLDESGNPTRGWRNMADGFEVEVPCQDTHTFVVIGFSDTDDDYQYGVQFQEETCSLACGAVLGGVDQCVVGHWEVVDAAEDFRSSPFMTMMRGFATMGGGSIDQVDIHTETYTFAADGTFSSNRPMTMSGRGNDGANDFEITMDIRVNEDRGRWGTNGRRMTLCTERNIWEATITGSVGGSGPEGQEISTDETVTDEEPLAARYTCDGNTLRIRPGANIFFSDDPIELNRLSSP
ncbi:hypothetical protein [Cognatiyoonia sp. IB215182]|uniref:hypothetical protein n=1 Tax=Cognatiyoonia sp. IB215182 TaxID=3097353 RepID=UPI002A13CE0F|nr:hypothetical protein [Cognatiyoonia sp. IB215182]MDX8353064.1 hypothetical protein [Cognatiyoonia sp. IB215182]